MAGKLMRVGRTKAHTHYGKNYTYERVYENRTPFLVNRSARHPVEVASVYSPPPSSLLRRPCAQ